MSRVPDTFHGSHQRAPFVRPRSVDSGFPQRLGAELRGIAQAALRPDIENALLLGGGFVCLLTIVVLTIALVNGPVFAWEIDITHQIQQVDYPSWLSALTAGNYTDPFSYQGAAIVALAAMFLFAARLQVEALLVVAMVVLRIPAHFSKAIVERERPSDDFDGIVGRGGGLSFASGHAEWVITFYGFLAVLAILHVQNLWARVLIAATYIAFVAVTTFARINGGHHWPLDMLGGWIIGAGLLCLAFWLRRALLATTAHSQSPETR